MRIVLAAVLLLGAALYLQWTVLRVEPPHVQVRPQPAGEDPEGLAAQAEQAFSVPLAQPDAFDVIAQRPLFMETRRPPELEPPPAKEPEQKPDAEGLDLSAIVITPGSTVALIKDVQTGETNRVKVGEDLRGWTVRSIVPGSVELAQGDNTKTLVLRDFSAPAVPKVPPKNLALQRAREQRAARMRALRQPNKAR